MFKLYTVERGTFTFSDYALLMQQVKDIGAETVLEFGPGISTCALIEAGVRQIVTLEHDPEWFDTNVERFKDYPHVHVGRYQDEPEVIAELGPNDRFDIAFVDSPKGYVHRVEGMKGIRKRHKGQEDCSRFNTCVKALEHAPVVLLHDSLRPLERGTLNRLNVMGHKITQLPSRDGMARIDRHGEKQTGPSL